MRIPAETVTLSDPISATRVLCGALILPTIATMVGKVMFGTVASNFQRTLLVSEIIIPVSNNHEPRWRKASEDIAAVLILSINVFQSYHGNSLHYSRLPGFHKY